MDPTKQKATSPIQNSPKQTRLYLEIAQNGVITKVLYQGVMAKCLGKRMSSTGKQMVSQKRGDTKPLESHIPRAEFAVIWDSEAENGESPHPKKQSLNKPQTHLKTTKQITAQTLNQPKTTLKPPHPIRIFRDGFQFGAGFRTRCSRAMSIRSCAEAWRVPLLSLACHRLAQSNRVMREIRKRYWLKHLPTSH